MVRPPHPGQRFRLTASTIARFFKHKCDRLFRWDAVEAGNRNRPGIGWNVPARVRTHSRPGIRLLMEAGDTFEIDNLEALAAEVGAEQVYSAGIQERHGRRTVLPVTLEDFAQLCASLPLPEYIAQLEIALPPEEESRFLRRFRLDPAQVSLGTAKPDLLEARVQEDGETLLRIWDFKASQVPRHEHFIQVAFYSVLMEYVVEMLGLPGIRLDTEFGVIRSRTADEEFELAPYRLAVEDFLRNRVPRILATPAADAHFHVSAGCVLCEYMDQCRGEADAGSDLSRIAYLSSESKRRLRRAGFRTHRDLAGIGPEAHAHLIDDLRSQSHDLSVNLPRYIATARALEDGRPRPLEGSTLQMPYWEDVRVVLSAEQDGVTGTCFALGIKTYEGWDEVAHRPRGSEQVFLADRAGMEGEMLLDFLRTLNGLLARVDAENRSVTQRPLEEEPKVSSANAGLAAAESALATFKRTYPRLSSSRPEHQALLAERERLQEEARAAKQAAANTRREAEWERRKQQRSLHFYLYDTLDLLALQGAIERHLFDARIPGLLDEIKHLVRLFPPSSVLPDADTFRSMPGTVVTQALRVLVALPAPYLYDLRSVSEHYQPQDAAQEDRGWVFRPRYGFGWEYSNQVAFERIHDVWRNQSFLPDPRRPEREMTPADVRAEIERTVLSKLRATDSVIRRLKQDHRQRRESGAGELLRLRKEPFRLFQAFDPTDFVMLDALRVFTMLESSLAELGLKHLHTMPVAERAAKFECIRGLRHLPELDEPDGSLWFTFAEECRDAKFGPGDFNLVLTPEDEPDLLMGDIDGPLFERAGWRYRNFKVALVEYDLGAGPPRVRLLPDAPARLREKVDLARNCVLDRVFADYTAKRVLDTLHRLQTEPESARHVHELIATGTLAGWQPFIGDLDAVERDLRARMAATTDSEGRPRDPDRVLNPGQWRAWRGVTREPLTLIWGPPGTGKTYTVAHILLGYALAARRLRRPLRILVTAFTHHAIVNVLTKVARLAEEYGLSGDELEILKAGDPNDADAELPDSVGRISDDDLPGRIGSALPACFIVGATVWRVHAAKGGGQPWFDVVLVDEASQMRLPDALIAFSASEPAANIILAGDDQQLPPIIHGTYPEEHEPMLSSVFAFVRHRMDEQERAEPGTEERMLFQLEDNFRMNEPLTAYPRDVLYRGRFRSMQPGVRIATRPALALEGVELTELLLHPERAAVLVWYTPPRSFTARNPIEAELAATLVQRLAEILVEDRDRVYGPAAFAGQAVAVLSPHRAQNSTIRQALAAIGFGTSERPMPLVDTVEKLQGKERDVVVVSYGVADEEYADAEADFLLSRNRFNVAATRARRKLIVLCSDAVLDAVPTDRRVLLESLMLKEYRQYCADGHLIVPWTSSHFGAIDLHVQWKGFPA